MTWALVAALIGTACANDTAAPATTDETRPDPNASAVILSTDTAMGLTSGRGNGVSAAPPDVDDNWAFALASDQAAIDLLGVVVTMGNGPVVPEVSVARATADILGSDVPVVEGAATWLSVEPLTDYTGSSLDGDCVNDGVRFMAEQLEARDEVTIVAIGPMTDVACVVLNFPELVDRVDRVVALIGNLSGDPAEVNGSIAGDFNYSMDPRAANLVLESDIAFTAISMNLAASALFPLSDIYDMAESSDPRGQYFGRASTPYAEHYEQTVGPEKPIWDAVAVWHLIEPSSQECASMGVVENSGAPGVYSDADTGLWFSGDADAGRQITVCTEFTSDAESERFIDAALLAVGGGVDE